MYYISLDDNLTYNIFVNCIYSTILIVSCCMMLASSIGVLDDITRMCYSYRYISISDSATVYDYVYMYKE